MNTTLIAIAFIDADGTAAPLSVFTEGTLPHRPSWAAAADLAIVLNEDSHVIAAAQIKAYNEDGTFVLARSSEWADTVQGLDLSGVITTTAWVRRRPTRYVTLELNGADVFVAKVTTDDIAARYAA